MNDLDMNKDFTISMFQTPMQHIAIVKSGDGYKFFINSAQVDPFDFLQKTGWQDIRITQAALENGGFDSSKEWTHVTVNSVAEKPILLGNSDIPLNSKFGETSMQLTGCTSLKHLDQVVAKVKIRRELAPVKPEAEQIDGRTFNFYSAWIITEDDSNIYVGEHAMMSDDPEYPKTAPRWIASGDLEILPTEQLPT